MCCDKRYIYSSDLLVKTNYEDFNSSTNEIDTAAIGNGDFIHDNVIQISCATSETNGYGEIIGLQLMEVETGTLQKPDLRIWIFESSPSATIAKNAPRSWTTTDALKIAGWIDVDNTEYTDMQASSPVSALVVKDLRNGTAIGSQPITFHTVTSSSTIYAAIEARQSVDFDNTAAIRIRLLFRRR